MEQNKFDVDELWDEFSEHIDDDIGDLSRWAGSSAINRISFNTLMAKIHPQPTGMRWVRWKDNPPKAGEIYYVKFLADDRPEFWHKKVIFFDEVVYKSSYFSSRNAYYLDESTAPDPINPIDFAKWYAERVTPYGIMYQVDGKLYLEGQLLILYKQQTNG